MRAAPGIKVVAVPSDIDMVVRTPTPNPRLAKAAYGA